MGPFRKKMSMITFKSLLLVVILMLSGYGAIAQFSYNPSEFSSVKPWTCEYFKNKPCDFKFAIIGDRTGGANVQGTFALAMNQLNLLQPTFVMSVGDYIEGYSTKLDVLNREWNEFQSIVAKLQMPFFYVRGNHDVNFPLSKKVWRERFGPGYYHFIYDNVLFIALDTEDADRPLPPNMEKDIDTYNRLKKENPDEAKAFLHEWINTPEAIEAFGHGAKVKFPEKQINWFKKVLAENPNVRWTFLFLHEPVWDNPSEGFKEIQNLLISRKHTFFAGHLHYYDYDNIDGVEYITMGPAGAAFLGQEGPGNVDHIMIVTMTDDGPQMANIALKGLFDRKGLDPSLFGAYDRPIGPGYETKQNMGLGKEGRTISVPGQSLGIASVPNLRDLGGYKTRDGHTVAAGLVYRSDQLSGVSPGDMEKIADLRLKNVYDLRTFDERQGRPDQLPPCVNYAWLDILADSPQSAPAQVEELLKNPKKANEVLGGGKVEAAFKQAYREFVSLPSANVEYRTLFLSLADRKQLPSLFHCTTGKDRTGWAAAALLSLVGVPKDKVMEDYLRSNDYIIPAYQKAIDTFVAGGGDRAIPLAILGVKKDYLNAAFDEMQKKYGTIENYFSKGLGINTTQQKVLRDILLVQE